MSTPRIIGIAGASCSGKTTVAKALAHRLGDVVTIALDSYYYDLSHLAPDRIHAYNLDEPSAIDYRLLIGNIADLAAGRRALKPVYDHKTHARRDPEPIFPSRFIILEGLFTFYWDEVRKYLHKKVFIDAAHDVCLKRRIDRDRSQRGRTADQVRRRYRTTVQPMFDAHVLPTRSYADLVINGVDPVEQSAATIVEALQE